MLLSWDVQKFRIMNVVQTTIKPLKVIVYLCGKKREKQADILYLQSQNAQNVHKSRKGDYTKGSKFLESTVEKHIVTL